MGIYFLMQDHCIPGQNEQKKETKKGTLKSHMIPLTMAAGRISLPDTLRITGRHTSIASAPIFTPIKNSIRHMTAETAVPVCRRNLLRLNMKPVHIPADNVNIR